MVPDPKHKQIAAGEILHAVLIDIVNEGFCLYISPWESAVPQGVAYRRNEHIFQCVFLMRKHATKYEASIYAAMPSTRRSSGDASKSFHVEFVVPLFAELGCPQGT